MSKCIWKGCTQVAPESSFDDGADMWVQLEITNGVTTKGGAMTAKGLACPRHWPELLGPLEDLSLVKEEAVVPQEKIRDHVKCSHEGCQSVFWRPQEVASDAVQPISALSTPDLAQLHGWTLLDREKGLLHCAWGHPKD